MQASSSSSRKIDVRVRPTLLQTVSSPVSPPSSPRRMTQTSERSSQLDLDKTREWNLFSQLMEDEGQLRSPSLKRVYKRSSRQLAQSQFDSSSFSRSSIKSLHVPGFRSESDNPHQDEFLSRSPDQNTDGFPPLTSADSFHDEHLSDNDSGIGYESSSANGSADTEPSVTSKERPSFLHQLSIPRLSVLHKNVIKCAVAYFIASLFTFVPSLSMIVGSIGDGERQPSPSGHMVATIAVYFNPAKTYGAMLEADVYCIAAFLWASFLSLGSMGMFWWLEVKPGLEWLANLLVLLWIGLGMTLVAFMKVWMAKPSFNPACSMTAIILFIVVVKEGGFDTLMQVSLIVVIGSLVSNLVCFVLWPQKASKNLQNNMTQTLDSFSTLLCMLTNTFLLSDASQPSQGKLQRAVDSHQASFTNLKKNLDEARSEGICENIRGLYSARQGDVMEAYEDAVGCLNRLGQHLNGLRGGIRLQYDLARAFREGKIDLKGRASETSKQDSSALQTESLEMGTSKNKMLETSENIEEEEIATLQAVADIFGDLVDDMGPPMKALTSACVQTLRTLRETFEKTKYSARTADVEPQGFIDLVDNIRRALHNFESTSNMAVLRIYRRNDNITSAMSEVSYLDSQDQSMLSQAETGNAETIFLVYFFIFTLQEFAKELTMLVNAMTRIYVMEHAQSTARNPFLEQASRIFSCFREIPCSRRSSRKEGNKPSLTRRFSTIFSYAPRDRPIFPRVRPHAPNTVQTPSASDLSFVGKINQFIWRIGDRLKERTILYALKAGMATAILASPAFFDATRPLFVRYRGEWALISFFVVISPTIGATNFLSFHRVAGTIIGALTAVGAFAVFRENAVALALFGFIASFPCFYYIVAKPQYSQSGRFLLLTYNLTCLYCYNLRESDISVFEVAFHRAVSVTIGVVYALLVSRLWWPSEARRELTRALSEFCLNIGWLYTHLVAHNSGVPVNTEIDSLNDTTNRQNLGFIRPDSDPTETTLLLTRSATEKLNDSIRTFMAMELHLQIKLIEIQGLLAQTQHEPRLKGPFPVQMYRSILTSLQSILDKLHSMRCVTTREEWFTTVRRDFVLPVNKERREMVGNVILYFYILSAAFRLKSPLPPYLPPAEYSRQRLVEAIRQLDIVKTRNIQGSRQLLFFAYALTMKGVVQELESLGELLQDAFGVIGRTSEAFEALFTDRSAIIV